MTIENATLLPPTATVNPSPGSASFQTSVTADSGGFTDALTVQLNNLNAGNVTATATLIDPLTLLTSQTATAGTAEVTEATPGNFTPTSGVINDQAGKILPQILTEVTDDNAQQALDEVLQFLYPASAQTGVQGDLSAEQTGGKPTLKRISDSEPDRLDDGILDPAIILPLTVNNIVQQPQPERLEQNATRAASPTLSLIAGQNAASAPALTPTNANADTDQPVLGSGLAKALGDQSATDEQGTNFDNAIKLAFEREQTQTGLANSDASVLKDSAQNLNSAQGFFIKNSDNISANPLNNQPLIVNAEIGQPEWQAELGNKILWLHNQSLPSAEIQLNPEHLGPISIKIDVNQDQASVAFSAQQASVREALEASIPKLKELFTNQQLNLSQVNISEHFSSGQGHGQQQNFNQHQAHSQSGQGTGTAVENNPASILDHSAQTALTSKGLLSLYA